MSGWSDRGNRNELPHLSISLLVRPLNRMRPVNSSYTTQPMDHMSSGYPARGARMKGLQVMSVFFGKFTVNNRYFFLCFKWILKSENLVF